jgi:hypothetical protein
VPFGTAQPAVVLPVRKTSAGRAAATAMAASSMGRKLSASGVKPNEMRATRGITKPAIWALEASGISVASMTLPRRASSTALPCSVAFPMIATITAATKNSERCAARAKACSTPTSVSLTKAVAIVARPSTTRAAVNDQPVPSGSAGLKSCHWRRSVYRVTITHTTRSSMATGSESLASGRRSGSP